MGVVASKKKDYNLQSVEVMETFLCREGDMDDGEMKTFQVGTANILLVKQGNEYSALGSKCTHYGAPLVKGILKDGIIRCPWHGACFNATTGDIEDFPGLDSLPCFEVIRDRGNVVLKGNLEDLKVDKRVKPICRELATVPKTFVIVGGGGAGQSCIQTLRQNKFNGKLILISKEGHLPYDRPKLSKALNAKAKDIQLRNDDFYKEAEVTLVLNTTVTSINTKDSSLVCDDGKLVVKYDSLMIATGSRPAIMNVEGFELNNVCLLRTPEDANYIAANSAGKAVVIVGTSFIGMEVASALLTAAKSVCIIGRSKIPFSASFGKEIGRRIKKMYKQKGVTFYMKNGVKRFLGHNNTLIGIELLSHETIMADICIVGIGVQPNTFFLTNSNIDMTSNHLVKVNEYLETNIKGVYACGDIVEFPLLVYEGKRANICHWQMALKHGHTAAMNMLGFQIKLQSVPYFWSVMFGKSFRYAGYAKNFEDVEIEGDVEGLEFAAYFLQKGIVAAMCSVAMDPLVSAYASDVFCGGMVTRKKFEKKISKVPSLSKVLSEGKRKSKVKSFAASNDASSDTSEQEVLKCEEGTSPDETPMISKTASLAKDMFVDKESSSSQDDAAVTKAQSLSKESATMTEPSSSMDIQDNSLPKSKDSE